MNYERFVSIILRESAGGETTVAIARRAEPPECRSLPRRPLDLAFLFRLLPERSVVIAAQMDPSRLADQLQLGQGLLDLLRRQGPLRFLAAIDDAAHLVCGHRRGDAKPDICTCAVTGACARTASACRPGARIDRRGTTVRRPTVPD